MIKWKKLKCREYGPQYDARVGHLFVRVQDNGEGWFNWHVGIHDMGIANEEHGNLEAGGEPSESKAKAAVRPAVRKIIGAMERGL